MALLCSNWSRTLHFCRELQKSKKVVKILEGHQFLYGQPTDVAELEATRVPFLCAIANKMKAKKNLSS